MKKVKYISCWIIIFLALIISLPSNSFAQAKDYPKEPITFLVPFGAGGATDLAARAVARFIPNYLGQNLVVVNKPGAGGAVAMESLIRSKPDGYTMMMAAIATNALTPAFTPNLPFKYDEITFICRTQLNPAVLVVKADAPWKSLKDLITDLKRNPGKYMYGTSGIGSMHNLAAYKFFKVTGIDPRSVTMIPFNSGKEQVVALLGGNIHFSYMNLIEPLAQLKAGQLKALAVVPKRLEEFPDIPTFAELGYGEVDVIGWRGVVGPPNLPEEIIKKWTAAMEKVCHDKGWIDTIVKLGDLPGFLGPKEFKDFVASQYNEAKKLAETLGIRK